MFLCIIYIAIWGKRDSVNLLNDEDRRTYYIRPYNIIAALMASFILIAVVLIFLFGTRTSIIFFVEVGDLVFAGYWLLMAKELSEPIDQECRAGKLHGQLALS
jgi:hypothetical protein